jgi:hypothetical protein
MPTLREVNDLVERMRRLIRRTEVTPGQGQVWSAEVPAYGIQTYRLTGMKSPAEIEDDLSSLGLWVWSMKDYLKKLVQSRGGDPEDVERYVDSTSDLRICADIANTAKHTQLSRSRTGRYLRAGRPTFAIPQAALGSLTFLENEVRVDVSKPELVTFAYPLVDDSGKEIGDAMKHLEAGLAAWEKYVEQIR